MKLGTGGMSQSYVGFEGMDISKAELGRLMLHSKYTSLEISRKRTLWKLTGKLISIYLLGC